ncbi:transposable element Tc1 transposase [Trichonephila clavipes]|nr:transposable element Tc1 transposase [Trichonephila clavipes]
MGEDYRSSRRRIFLSRNRGSCVAEQFHSDASLEAVDRRAPSNSKNWQWTAEGSWQHVDLLLQVYLCRLRQFVDVCCTVDYRIRYTGSLSRQTIDGCVCNGLMSTESGKLIGTKLSFQGVISYHGRSYLLRIEGNLNSNRYIHEVLQPEVFPFRQGLHAAIFQQNNARPHAAKTVRDFCSTQPMPLLPWPSYSPDMSPIEYVWHLVGRRFARDPRPAASKDELLLRMQAIWNSLPQADTHNLFDSMPSRIAALIATRGDYTKY